MNQVKGGCERGDEAIDFSFNLGAVLFELVDVVETLAEFDSLLMGDSAVHSGLNLGDWGFTAPVNERRDVKRLPGVRQDVLGDGTRGLAEHVREHIVEFEVGHGEAVLSAVLLAGDHVGELHAIANQIAKLANDWRRDKAGLDHAAHEQVANPAGVLAVCLVALHGFGVLWMGERDLAGLFEDIEYGNPVFPGGFHADLCTVILRQPCGEVSQTLGEGLKTGFIILGSVVVVSNTNASVNPGLVNVETAAVIQNDFEHGVPPANYLQGPSFICRNDSD